MNPGTKAKTIWMILLAVLLLAIPAIPAVAVLADDSRNPSDTTDGEYFSHERAIKSDVGALQLPPPPPPLPPELAAKVEAVTARLREMVAYEHVCRHEFAAELARLEAELYDMAELFGLSVERTFDEYICERDFEIIRESLLRPPPLPAPAPVPPSEPPPEVAPHQKVEAVREAQTPKPGGGEPAVDDEVGILLRIGGNVHGPRRVGGEVHGSGYTYMDWTGGVDGDVSVWVGLWWWDGTRWQLRGSASAADTWAPPGGRYYAEATAESIHVAGFWATTGSHQARQNGQVIWSDTTQSPIIYLP
ncbi:hypothetical protein M1O14_02000 [Dehalococcoidia bacterium]|nr:hypothetical protein [Dehalococcoidia bacterium]